jgi:hypothetical protein
MFFLTLIIFELIMDQASSTVSCNYNCPKNETIVCGDFNSWSKLNEALNQCSINCTHSSNLVYLKPIAPIMLTSELNTSFLSISELTTLYYVSGVNVYPWPALRIQGSSSSKMSLKFYFSTVEFYVNNTLPDEYTCSPGIIPDDSSKSVSLFSTYLDKIEIDYGNTYGSASQAVCPFVFKNARLDEFDLKFQVDSFLFVSLLRFQKVNLTTPLPVNSTISTSDVNGYNFKLDEGLLHPLVFEKLTSVYLDGMIQSIQTDLFVHFEHLFDLTFDMNSLGNFYHKIGVEWMNYLNMNSFVELYSKLPYSYPDRDFCIFAQFPVNGSIHLTIDTTNVTSLTYARLCKAGNIDMTTFPCNQTINLSNYQTINNDIIDEMLKLCKIKRNETDKQPGEDDCPSYADSYHTQLVRMLFVEIVPFVLIPCACLIGLFFNWKIIQTINKNKNKSLKEDFYKYMSANAKFNCLYCLILVFYPMTSCIWRLDTTFCSSIFTTQFVQYFKIVMMAYFGEVVKMCANISYLMMTLNRYLLVGKDHAPWLVTLAKLEFKWVICGSILFSALINIGHGWQYQAVNEFQVELGKLEMNGNSYSNYPLANQGTAYFIYSIVYFCINFGVFFILNTGLEVKIVRRMQKELSEKRKRLAKMNFSKSAVQTGSVGYETTSKPDLEEKKREEDDSEKERKVIKMVVLNGIFNFVLRAPEMLFWIENSNSWRILFSITVDNTDEFSFPGFLNLIADIGYLAFILTFSSNFFIFYKFNKNFKEAVVLFLSKKQNENSKK